MRYRRGADLDLENAKLDRAVARRAWQFLRPYRALLLLYLVAIVVSSALGVLPPLIFKRLIDDAIPARDLGAVNLLAMAAVGVAVVTTALSLLNRWFGARIGEGVIYDLRVALYHHVQSMPLAFFTRTQTGALLSRLSTDVVGAQQTVGTVATVTSDVLQLTTTLAAMVLLSWQITGLALMVLPVFIVLDRRLGSRLKQLARQRMHLNAGMSTNMTERFNVSGALLVKLFGRPKQEAAEFAARAADVRDTGVTQAFTGRILFAALGLVGAVGTAGVYWLGARSVIRGTLELGTVVALAAYVQRLYSPLTDLAGARVDLLTAMVSFERVFEVLDAPRAIEEAPDAVGLERPRGLVEVDDVWFRYPSAASVSIASLEADSSAVLDAEPGPWVLRGVSFRAEPGTLTALVGPSGAGKTTLSHLVPRLYDVSAGAVRIDGRDVRTLMSASLVDAIGVVTQDAHLFHDSVAANLRYAKPGASDPELEAACRAARIHDVIAALPDGYDTVVGERGYRLSGGEKQRLAIARVLLKNPAIVILDEATAHLDSETEALVQQALASALEGRTSIVIALRLSTILAADQILVLDGGRIVERGTHDALVGGGGLYAELYETQYLRGVTPDAAEA
ncbi:MAG: ABC transporter ATP-binding protein/permease [Actinobacteria bacterium]|nr:ABC transporter ATP-binding protein/permease [Actinomycetota bacterium]